MSHVMRIAKATPDDFEHTMNFFHACEVALESRSRSPFFSAERNWLNLDEDDPDYILLIKIRREIADERDIEDEDVDNRMILYEFLKQKFIAASVSWRRTMAAGAVAIDEGLYDPTLSYLDYNPAIVFNHVDPEQ